jgi:hypothetical protein
VKPALLLREEHRLRVTENRVVRRIFGLKLDEVTGERRKLQNEELHILCSSPNIIRQIKSRTMRWVWHVAQIGGERNCTRFWWERDHSENGDVDRMGSEWILGRLAGDVWSGLSWLRIGTSAGFCEYDDNSCPGSTDLLS